MANFYNVNNYHGNLYSINTDSGNDSVNNDGGSSVIIITFA